MDEIKAIILAARTHGTALGAHVGAIGAAETDEYIGDAMDNYDDNSLDYRD